MKRYNFLLLIVASLLVMASCNKNNGQKIKIKDNVKFTKLGKNKTADFQLEGVETDYILFGGNMDTTVKGTKYEAFPYPILVEGSNSIKLVANVDYKNEFYVMTKEITSDDASCVVQDQYGTVWGKKFPKGSKVTFVWIPEKGALGYYFIFELFNWIKPLAVNDTLSVMRIAENTTKSTIQNTDNVRAKMVMLKMENGVPQQTNLPQEKPIVFQSKQKIAICEHFVYKGNGIYQSALSIIENEEETNYNTENNNFGL